MQIQIQYSQSDRQCQLFFSFYSANKKSSLPPYTIQAAMNQIHYHNTSILQVYSIVFNDSTIGILTNLLYITTLTITANIIVSKKEIMKLLTLIE